VRVVRFRSPARGGRRGGGLRVGSRAARCLIWRLALRRASARLTRVYVARALIVVCLSTFTPLSHARHHGAADVFQ